MSTLGAGRLFLLSLFTDKRHELVVERRASGPINDWTGPCISMGGVMVVQFFSSVAERRTWSQFFIVVIYVRTRLWCCVESSVEHSVGPVDNEAYGSPFSQRTHPPLFFVVWCFHHSLVAND